MLGITLRAQHKGQRLGGVWEGGSGAGWWIWTQIQVWKVQRDCAARQESIYESLRAGLYFHLG